MCGHAHISTLHKQIWMHALMHMYVSTHACMVVSIHTNIHTYMHAQAHMHAYRPTYFLCTYVRKYIHTHTHKTTACGCILGWSPRDGSCSNTRFVKSACSWESDWTAQLGAGRLEITKCLGLARLSCATECLLSSFPHPIRLGRKKLTLLAASLD